jgi:hypothetical protein
MKIVCFSATENIELLNNKLVQKKLFINKTNVFQWNREGVELSENSTLTFRVISCVFGDEKVSLRRGEFFRRDETLMNLRNEFMKLNNSAFLFGWNSLEPSAIFK